MIPQPGSTITWKKPNGRVATMRVDHLKAWLRGKRATADTTTLPGAVARHHNALLGELLQEIEDAEKEG